MADTTTTTELEKDWEQFHAQEYQRLVMNWVVYGLLAVGILLVLCAESLGTLSAQHWNSTAPWYPEEAHAAANTFRILGLMLFVSGLVERVVLVIRSQFQQVA